MSEQLVNFHNDPAIPEWLARLKRAIVERLPTDEAQVWHGSFLEAITPGVDLEPIRHKLAILRIDRLIALQTHALEKHHAHGVHEAISKVLTALHQVRRCHEAELQGQVCDLAAAELAWSAKLAAWSAGDAAWKQEADDLIELLQEAGGN